MGRGGGHGSELATHRAAQHEAAQVYQSERYKQHALNQSLAATVRAAARRVAALAAVPTPVQQREELALRGYGHVCFDRSAAQLTTGEFVEVRVAVGRMPRLAGQMNWDSWGYGLSAYNGKVGLGHRRNQYRSWSNEWLKEAFGPNTNSSSTDTTTTTTTSSSSANANANATSTASASSGMVAGRGFIYQQWYWPDGSHRVVRAMSREERVPPSLMKADSPDRESGAESKLMRKQLRAQLRVQDRVRRRNVRQRERQERRERRAASKREQQEQRRRRDLDAAGTGGSNRRGLLALYQHRQHGRDGNAARGEEA